MSISTCKTSADGINLQYQDLPPVMLITGKEWRPSEKEDIMSVWVKVFKGFLIRTGFIFIISLICVFPCVAKENSHQTERAADYNTSDVISEISKKSREDVLDVYVKETPRIDTFISGASALLSFVAIIVSICSVRVTNKMTKETISLQKKHNRDEVRPMLCMHFDANDMSIVLKNHGLGPAVIKSMKWSDASNNSEPTLVKLNEDKWRLCQVSNFYIYTKRFLDDKEDPDILAPQESLCFIKGDQSREYDFRKRLAQSFDGVKVELTYTDIYEEGEWTVKKDCSWFYYQYYR